MDEAQQKGLVAAPLVLFVFMIVATYIAVFVTLVLLIFFVTFAVLYGVSRGTFFLVGLRSELANGLAKVALVPLCGLLAYLVTAAILNGPTRCGDEVRQTPFGALMGTYYKDPNGNVTDICWPYLDALPQGIGREWSWLKTKVASFSEGGRG